MDDFVAEAARVTLAVLAAGIVVVRGGDFVRKISEDLDAAVVAADEKQGLVVRVDVLERRDVRKAGGNVRLSVVNVDDGDPTRLLNVPDRDGGLPGDDNFVGKRVKDNCVRKNCRNVAEDGRDTHGGHWSVDTASAVPESVPLHFGLHSDLVVSVKEPLASPVTFGLVVAVTLFALVTH